MNKPFALSQYRAFHLAVCKLSRRLDGSQCQRLLAEMRANRSAPQRSSSRPSSLEIGRTVD